MEICDRYGRKDYLDNLRAGFEANGVAQAVEARNNAVLYDFLMECFNYQGVADKAAASYLQVHGSASLAEVAHSLNGCNALCSKLQNFNAFVDCGYEKSTRTCNEPRRLASCPLPSHPWRKGALNQAAYSLHLFLRDRANGDLVDHIDRLFERADVPGHPDRVQFMRNALVEEFTLVYGISSKVIQMTLADFLLGCGAQRPRWFETGASMIAVDSLVHNFLQRSGILYANAAVHLYGVRCYGASGCLGVLDQVARQIDARQFNADFPAYFPRFVQHSLWAFCAQGQFNVCNGVNIDDDYRCTQKTCPVFPTCGRIALRT